MKPDSVIVRLRVARRGGWSARAGRSRRARTATSVRDPIAAVRRAAAKFFRLCPICNIQGPADLVVDEHIDVGSSRDERTFTVTRPQLPVT